MSFSSTTFSESLEPDSLQSIDPTTHERRLKTYSLDALRVAADLERIFVKHPQFNQIIDSLDRLFQLGTELETPLGFRLVGPPGVGKSAAFAYFRKTLPPSTFFDKPSAALEIRVPKKPHAGVLIKALLRAVEYPFSEGTYKQLYARRAVVFEALRAKGTRLLWIDEAHHLIIRRAGGISVRTKVMRASFSANWWTNVDVQSSWRARKSSMTCLLHFPTWLRACRVDCFWIHFRWTPRGQVSLGRSAAIL